MPYVIWANYDIKEGQNEDTSANFLAAKVLKTAGIPLSDYENYLLDLSEKLPVISAERIVDADGNEQTLKTSEELKEYQKMQYYRLFDAGKGE